MREFFSFFILSGLLDRPRHRAALLPAFPPSRCNQAARGGENDMRTCVVYAQSNLRTSGSLAAVVARLPDDEG